MQCSQMSCTLGLFFNFMFPQLVTNAFYVCVIKSDVLFNLMFWLSMQLVLESPIWMKMTALLQPGGQCLPELTVLFVFPSGHLPYCNKLISPPKNLYFFQTLSQRLFVYLFISYSVSWLISLTISSLFFFFIISSESKSVNVKCIALKSCWSVSIVCISAANICDCRPLELIMAV